MKKPKAVCVICGKKDGVKGEWVKNHPLPHGSLSLCSSTGCLEMLLLKTEGSVPIVWVGKEDYLEHELLTKEEMNGHDNAVIEAARSVCDYISIDSFWEDWNSGLAKSVIEFEQQVIRDTPKKDLPLLIGHLKHGNEDYLAERIKGEAT